MKLRGHIIAAVAENSVIGKNNDLIWYLPADLAFFKEKTRGCSVIMGRRNYDSIPERYRPLPGRKNIVVSRTTDLHLHPDVLIAASIEQALELASKESTEIPFIIGGGQVYQYALDHDLVDKMYITHIHQSFEGDTFFPIIDSEKWSKTWEEYHPKDHHHQFDFTFTLYEKKR
ncbi:MAG TPA: diacylglycerol kinase [Flavobacteriales bacterium]|nr:diacylglycerol kinase [Flavobacteriales bacterium]